MWMSRNDCGCGPYRLLLLIVRQLPHCVRALLVQRRELRRKTLREKIAKKKKVECARPVRESGKVAERMGRAPSVPQWPL